VQRISNTGFSTRIRTINTIVLTNAILHIQFAMCREYSKVFLPPEDDNAQIWQFMNFPEFVSVSDQVLYFSKAINLFDLYEGEY